MERATGIGGVFVRSTQPWGLRAWHAEHLGVDLEEWGGTAFRSGGCPSRVSSGDQARAASNRSFACVSGTGVG